MSKKQKSEHRSAPATQKVNNGKTAEEKPIRYVVVREGYRVSDRDYETPLDPVCVAEVDFWTRVAQNHSYGEKVEAVEYDSKRHRVW